MSANNTPNTAAADTTDDGIYELGADTNPTQENTNMAAATEAPVETNGKAKTKAKNRTGGKGKTPPKQIVIAAEPKGTERVFPLKEITRTKELQMRASFINEETVEQYKELYQDNPDALPPVKVMEIPQDEADGLGLSTRYVLWDGFQRIEARQRAGLKEIACVVAKGNWATARLLALHANHDAALKRSFSDIRRALQTLLDDEDMLTKVLEAGVGNGGANRAIAAAAGVSKGLVSKVLNSLGKTTRGDKIVNLPKKPEAEKSGAADVNNPGPAMRTESVAAIRSRMTANLIHEMQYDLSAVIRRYRALLERPDARSLLLEVSAKHGLPIHVDANWKAEEAGEASEFSESEYWPAVDSLLMAVDELKEQHDKLSAGASK